MFFGRRMMVAVSLSQSMVAAVEWLENDVFGIRSITFQNIIAIAIPKIIIIITSRLLLLTGHLQNSFFPFSSHHLQFDCSHLLREPTYNLPSV